MVSPCVELTQDGIWINGQPLILLTSSLFYFRLPASEWRNRMRTLRFLGYNAIDVYFPWNYHELEPGQWDFVGGRDVRAFLQLAREEGLWVVARPGPFICSEWDGGALPAYLNTIPGIKLRDGHPDFLQSAKEWYSHIIPLLAEFQVENGGTVILVQIENELDFYDCADRAGLMTALRDSARSHGISVPLIACSGEGDLAGATGGIDGVVPSCNFYFDSLDPQLEERIRHYALRLRNLGFPLCITETNRAHADLRRLLAGGAKLLGPYLQTGGTDFGFTTSVTNWGDPLAFMTSHYDFGGMISPGGRVRPEGHEAILLTKMIKALGSALALSAPVESPPVSVRGIEGAFLNLKGGGWLAGIPNLCGNPVQVQFAGVTGLFPAKTILEVPPGTCPFILVDFPLSNFGFEGLIEYATSELVDCSKRDELLELTFATDGSSEVALQWQGASLEQISGWRIEPLPQGWRFWIDKDLPAEAELVGTNGKRLRIRAEDRANISSLESVELESWQRITEFPRLSGMEIPEMEFRLTPFPPCSPDWFVYSLPCEPDRLFLEQNRIYRGFGWYRSVFNGGKSAQGFLARSAADILSLYVDGQFFGTRVPAGGDAYWVVPDAHRPSTMSELVVRAEIWGHANFDDHRLPALRLNSMRGMGDFTVIEQIDNLTSNWFYHHRAQNPANEPAPEWPLLNFGGWSTTDEPSQGVYYRNVDFIHTLDTRVLHFPGLQVRAEVYLDGRSAGVVNPLNPFLDISHLSREGVPALIAVAVDQHFRRPTGEALLYQGASLSGWELSGWGESGLAGMAEKYKKVSEPIKLPFSLGKGEMAWLYADIPLSADWNRRWGLQLVGQGLKVSAWIGNHLTGRLWLPSLVRPRMTGGADDRMVLPTSWLQEAHGSLHMLLESVDDHRNGELRELKLTLDI